MNEQSLSALYRRMTATPATGHADADDLVAALAGEPLDAARRDAVASALASSSRNADLARLLRDLAPDSAELAAAAAAARGRAAHRRVGRAETRHASHAPRRRRVAGWVGALAACFVFAFALSLRDRHEAADATWNDVAASATSAALPDRIFTSQDRIFAASDHAAAMRDPADSLFRAGFVAGG